MDTSQTAAQGDADVTGTAALFADRARTRMLAALADGRALPASTLASEAGISPQAASAHLARLTGAGFLEVERSGRHRYYRIASPQIAVVFEALASISPGQPIRSLSQSTRAAALRRARSCYDHLAGRLGVAVTQSLLDRRALVRTDGVTTIARREGDLLSSRMPTHPYRLGPHADTVFAAVGVPAERLVDDGRRPLLRFCVDWSEQRHHLAGRLGADLLTAFLDAGWLRRRPGDRALRLTDDGRETLRSRLGVDATD